MTRTPQNSDTPAASKAKPAPKSKSKSKPEPRRGSPHPLPSKLQLLVSRLRHKNGATLAELATATGWQVHSVRGALAGSLKKKGHVITSGKVDGARRYYIGTPS